MVRKIIDRLPEFALLRSAFSRLGRFLGLVMKAGKRKLAIGKTNLTTHISSDTFGR